MGDGNFTYFLIIVFVLWVLESIAKARQRSRMPEEMPGDDQIQPTTPFEVTTETRPRTVERPPRTLWEEIAEIARQQLPPDQRLPLPGEAPQPPRADLPAPVQPTPVGTGRRPEPTARTSPSRWEQGTEREVVIRPTPAEVAPAEERRSDRWVSGAKGEARSTDDVVRTESLEVRARRADLVKKERADVERLPKKEVQRRKAQKAAPAGRPVPPAQEERRRTGVSAPKATLSAPVAAPRRTPEQSIRSLKGAPRAELRRFLILQEVLGPPVALREDPLSEMPVTPPSPEPREAAAK